MRNTWKAKTRNLIVLEEVKCMTDYIDVEDQLEHLEEMEQERFDRDCDAHIMREEY